VSGACACADESDCLNNELEFEGSCVHGRCVCTEAGGCSSGLACVQGTCVCPQGQTNCSDSCVDTRSDLSNCGWCGQGCDTFGGQKCTNGTCGCPDGQTYCPVNGNVEVMMCTDTSVTGVCDSVQQ
jgi:hypothetical protein